jgi:hypothetical protein
LDYENGEYVNEQISTYGLDASTIIKTYLHQANKDIDVQRDLDELFKLLDEEEVIEAKKLLQELEKKFTDRLPEITRAKTLLSFYEA